MAIRKTWTALSGLLMTALVTSAHGQFTEDITGFETDRNGDPLVFQTGSFGPLEVVIFQDPREADVTAANVVADPGTLGTNGPPIVRSSEESFVANFTGDGFFGAGGSDQFLDIRFEWEDPGNDNRWVLAETLQSPIQGDPSLHLDGIVRMKINFPDCSAFEFPTLQRHSRIGVALLIRETGNDYPQGFQDNNPDGDLEFVGVSSVAGANTASPVPVPTTYFNITDADCTGSGADWVDLTFNLGTASVAGWTFRGGNGVLDATTNGEMVNRGVLAGLVLTPDPLNTNGEYVEFLIDNLEFESPDEDPAFPPTLGEPIILGDTSVRVNNVLSRSTDVQLEIDRAGGPVGFTEIYNINPGGALFVNINVPVLQIGDQLRARQTNPSGISPYSAVITVAPPAKFSVTMSLDEDGNGGVAPADFEFVGSSSDIPRGHSVFVQNGVWQKVEFSLIPGVEPVTDFAGGNGQLQPDGDSYNIDALWFTIDPVNLQTNGYDVFVDHVYIIDANDKEQVIHTSELTNPFPLRRGQSDAHVVNDTRIISRLASYDGTKSNRQSWDFVSPPTDNRTYSVFRPGVSFADSAKAMGVWMLVEDARTNGLPLPAVGGPPPPAAEAPEPLYGDVPFVRVHNINSNATQAEVLVNGVVAGSLALTPVPAGVRTADVPVSGTVNVADSVSARYTIPAQGAGPVSDLAFARGVLGIPVVTVPGPLVAGQTVVTVNNVLTLFNATASSVRVYDGNTQIGSAAGGTASVNVNVSPLVFTHQISATQVVNGIESAKSVAVVVGPAGCPERVVINEIQYDDVGTDDREFVELYNAGIDPVNISGWVLRGSDNVAPPGDDNPDYTISASTVLAPGEFWVVGTATVPNVDQIVGSTDLWENAFEALQLLDNIGIVVDTLMYESGTGTVAVAPGEGGGFWGALETSLDATPTKPSQSLSRWEDGYDTQNNGRDFGVIPMTPGASNHQAGILPYSENFDAGAVGADVPNWGGSFVNARYIDPTAIGGGGNNPNVIPASPQGGNAMIVWDQPGGGGDTAELRDQARYGMTATCSVYIDATNSPFTAANTANEVETWSIGIGTTDSRHVLNNPAAGATGPNGNTGLAWEYFKFEDAGNTGVIGGQFLLLKNENNGGADGVTILTVPPANLTTGWHTLSLTRNYENWSASFDGANSNGINSNGVEAGNGPGIFYVGYREGVVGIPATLRPPTIDALSVTVPTPPVLGACCTECSCEVLTTAECAARSGCYAGNGTTCADVNQDGTADACGIPDATVNLLTARKLNPSGPGGNCDAVDNTNPFKVTEPHQAGTGGTNKNEIHIGFDVPPGGGGSGWTLEESSCAAPVYVASPATQATGAGSVVGNDLVITFTPALPNARTYRINLGCTVTAIGGQSVEVRVLAGDGTGDGNVNAGDRSAVVGAWTSPAHFSCPTDHTNNGLTDAADRSAVVGAWTNPLARCAP